MLIPMTTHCLHHQRQPELANSKNNEFENPLLTVNKYRNLLALERCVLDQNRFLLRYELPL